MPQLRRPIALAAGLSLLAGGLTAVVATPAAAAPGSTVFINEIHYDNVGGDVGEFIEVAGPAGTNLSGWSLVPYNGNGGAPYSPTTNLTGTIPDQGGTGYGAISFPISGLQNGSPDGIALVNGSTAEQFLSYEGEFTAVGGAAAGQTSTDIGVLQDGSDAPGLTLQLTGTGTTYGDFTWSGPADDSPGAVNDGQTFVEPGGPAQPVAACGEGPLVVDSDASGSREVSASDADSRVVDATLVSTPVAGITLDDFAASAGNGDVATATLNVADTTPDGSYEVEVEFTTDDDQTATCTVTVEVRDLDKVTLISEIQGDGAASPLVDERVNVEAIVTSLITSNDVLDGFFLQEEDTDVDGDADTSEGLFVFCRNDCPDVAAGDRVRVTGDVAEFSDSTQIAAGFGNGSFEILAPDQPLPTAAEVELPAATSTKDAATFEHVEGMRTTISTTLAVSEYFQQARFGEIVLTANERPYQFTQTDEPSVEGYNAFLAGLETRRIILDDDSNSQNAATSGPDSNEAYYYPSSGLSTGNYFRGGDTITDLTGVFEYAFGAWKLRPVSGEDYTFEATNPRTESAPEVGGRLTVASFNVLNYFATIDDGAAICGPEGNQGCRGAHSEAERVRQLDKIVAALAQIDADVFGLIEIENDGGQATQQIVDALNTATGPGAYDYVKTSFTGSDVIRQAFIYKTGTVSPVGDFDLLTSEDDDRFDDGKNRPALIQTFEETATGERVTVAVNHLKSKGSDCGAGDDAADGSGNCDGTRTAAAEALADHLADDPTGTGETDTLIIGDLNSYAMERPITTLVDAGYTDLLQEFGGAEAYTYLFDGQLGTLDYGLANDTLVDQVTGAAGWAINADENPLFDYNDTVQDGAEASFERKSDALTLYEPNPYRASDHDPVIIGLALDVPVPSEVDLTLSPSQVKQKKETSTATVAVDGGDAEATGTVIFYVEGELVGSAELDGGSASLEIGPFRKGTYDVTVEYSGDDHYLPGSDSAVLQVGKDKKKDKDKKGKKGKGRRG